MNGYSLNVLYRADRALQFCSPETTKSPLKMFGLPAQGRADIVPHPIGCPPSNQERP